MVVVVPFAALAEDGDARRRLAGLPSHEAVACRSSRRDGHGGEEFAAEFTRGHIQAIDEQACLLDVRGQGYADGRCEAEEVADVINNRIQTYLNEQ